MNDQSNYYQLTYLLSPLLDKKGEIEINQKVKKAIEERQGQIKTERIININLTYPIKKHKQSTCANLSFELPPQATKNLEEQLKTESNIIRYMIQKKTILPPPAFVFQPTPSRFGLKQTAITAEEESPSKPLSAPAQPKKEKIKIEDLDKKLEEILNQ